MDFTAIPIWLLAILIFGLRVVDVALGTFRTISVVHGRARVSVLVGFFEVTIWVLAVAQVVSRIGEHPWLALAYSGGFAAGNAVGIAFERRLAIGAAVVRMITGRPPEELREALGSVATGFSYFAGTAREGPRSLIYARCQRRDLPRLIDAALRTDPELFYVIERFSTLGGHLPLPHPTGWRAVFKKK